MVKPKELEKSEEPTVVDSMDETELTPAEGLLNDEAANAEDDVGAVRDVDSEADVAVLAEEVEIELETVEEIEAEAETAEEIEAEAETAVEGEAEAETAEEGEAEAETAEEIEAEAEPAVEGEAEAETEGEAEAEKEPERPEGVAWFVVHSYSGYENKVQKNLEHRIESMGMQDQIFQVVVPTEEEVELRDGQRRTTERRVFPGYILVEMLMNDDTWYVVRNTPGVTDFVRSGTKPIPLRQEEVDKILKRMEAEAPKIKVSFREGQKVRIVDGPFEDFMGTVDAIDTDRARVRVLVNMFGRETPVEVDFLQVERV